MNAYWLARLIAPVCCVLCLTGSGAWAQLIWDATVAELKAWPNDQQVETVFKFSNTGAEPITIRSVQTTCGCTTTKLTQDTYAPGEAGEIGATVKLGGHAGVFERKINVYTSADDKATPLTVRVTTPNLLAFEPGRLMWEHDSEPVPQTLSIEVVHDQPINLTSATVSKPGFKVALQVTSPGHSYEVTVTPDTTTERKSAQLIILTDYPKDKPQRFEALVTVRPPARQLEPESTWERLKLRVVRWLAN